MAYKPIYGIAKKNQSSIVTAQVAGLILLMGSFLFGQTSARVVKTRGVFSLDAIRPGDAFKVAVTLEITQGYHINAHVPTLDYLIPTTITLTSPAGIHIAEPRYPSPTHQTFAFAPGAPLAVYQGVVTAIADGKAESSLQIGTLSIKADVRIQACNDTQCLAPSNLSLDIPVVVTAREGKIRQVNPEIFSHVPDALGQSPQATAVNASSTMLVQFGNAQRRNPISEMIESQGLLLTLVFVFLSGLALNTTPCVYPIIPITIGFFANQSEGRLRRTFLMAAAYVLGMAITYSILGVVASMTKGLFGAALQNPVVLLGLSGLMVVLAMSMFGVYEFRLPAFLNRFVSRTAHSRGGLAGAFLMGLMMGIVAAPCIGPFVLGLLVHVGTKGDPLYGFFLFFVLSLGLGLPYLILGTFSGGLKSLPRSGEWMVSVRKVFGLVLLGMAIYFVMPLLGKLSIGVLVVFLAASAFYLISWEGRRAKPKLFGWVLRTLGVGVAFAALVLAIPKKVEGHIPWQTYSPQALADAQRQGRPVIVDAYADWCIPCKELDKITFGDPSVSQMTDAFVCLKLDLTHNDPESGATRARDQFGIRGVPTILFFDATGKELPSARLEGFEKPAPFRKRLEQALNDRGS